MRAAVYPASFDPVTNGHLDIIERALTIFDRLHVVVFQNPEKTPMFTVAERLDMLHEVTGHLPGVVIESFSGLLVEFARQRGVRVVLRGLRAVSDFDNEFKMALMNKELDPEIETVFMMTSARNAFLSSSLVKEIALFGGAVDGLVPGPVRDRLAAKLQARRAGGGGVGNGV